MSKRASFFVSVAGQDVTGNFTADVMEISVTDSSGKSADTASIKLDDRYGHIAMPNIGDEIAIGIGWGAPVLIFEGYVDDVNSEGSRSGGRTLTISAKSADTVKGKLKEQSEKHEDDTTLGAVAQKWGQAAGLSEVHVHSKLASIERAYWSMNNESYAAWGERTARELGATFKVLGKRAVMVPRSEGISASGRPLVGVIAAVGINLHSWSIKPALGRPQNPEYRTRWFDIAEAAWKETKVGASFDTEADAINTTRFSELNDPNSGDKSNSDEKESDRERGGGTCEIEGDPQAQAEAPCTIQGARPGVDGPYRIDSVTHKYTRGGGFMSSLTLKQPGSGTGAGGDDRGAENDGENFALPTHETLG